MEVFFVLWAGAVVILTIMIPLFANIAEYQDDIVMLRKIWLVVVLCPLVLPYMFCRGAYKMIKGVN